MAAYKKVEKENSLLCKKVSKMLATRRKDFVEVIGEGSKEKYPGIAVLPPFFQSRYSPRHNIPVNVFTVC